MRHSTKFSPGEDKMHYICVNQTQIIPKQVINPDPKALAEHEGKEVYQDNMRNQASMMHR